MILHVVDAEYLGDYRIRVKFNDGAEGFVDLAGELHGAIFTPLRDGENFRSFKLDSELNTIVWQNGADLAPEFLRRRLRVPVDGAFTMTGVPQDG